MKLKAKLKGVTAKEGGIAIQLEPMPGCAPQVSQLMTKVGLCFDVTVEDQQLAIEGMETDEDHE